MTPAQYPAAPRSRVVDILHGTHVTDPYRWLEDDDTDETREWIVAQDTLYADQMAAIGGKDEFSRRVAELMAVGSISPPTWRSHRGFFTCRAADQELPVLYVTDANHRRRGLVDPLQIDPCGLTTIDAWEPDWQGSLLAFQLSAGGTEESVLHVLDVSTGAQIEAPINRCRYSPVAWLADGTGFFYVRQLPKRDGERVLLHHLGQDPKDDRPIFGDQLPPTTRLHVELTRDGRWLTISARAGAAPGNRVWLADLKEGSWNDPRFTAVHEDPAAKTTLRIDRTGRMYVLTDYRAPRQRLCVTTPERPGSENWHDLIPEDGERVLSSYVTLDDHLVVAWRRNASSELTVHDLVSGGRLATVPLPGIGVVHQMTSRPEGGHEVWLSFTDYTTPPTVLHADVRELVNGSGINRWETAPGFVGLPTAEVNCIDYPSADKTSVQMVTVSAAGSGEAPRPCLLTGYGGFGRSMSLDYSPMALAWVEAGGIFAATQLRGGGEKGRQWHRAGMRADKQKTIDDLHAAAETLISKGLTTPEQLAIYGASNGGLVVGAALTQRPDLYAAAVCAAPLLDMVRYELSGLGPMWTEEYGSARLPDEFAWIYGYSPYHRVREDVPYPAALFAVFEGDTRVSPWHARKMCAALQHATSSGRPVLLRREADVGHGARSASQSVQLVADILAFCGAYTGMNRGSGN